MNIQNLPSLVTRAKKRLGRGHGSGRGKTAGRGTKGQKARGKIPHNFEGGQLTISKRLPLLRGKGRNKGTSVRPYILTLTQLARASKDTPVTLASLKKQNIVPDEETAVKILANGTIDIALTVSVPCSKQAKASIEKAGGTVTSV